MSAFGGLILTNKGRALQAKAQTGTQLNFTRMAAGDGELGGTSIQDLNVLIHEVKSLVLTKLQTLSNGKALVRTFFSNQDVITGFYFREFGVFAQDPDEGEILYCYGNAGANAEYIPAAGGADIIEKNIDVITIVGNASNVTATIDESLIFASAAELIAVQNEVEAIENGDRTLDQTQTPAGNVGPLQTILDWFANRIKAITGKNYWYEAPDTSLSAAKAHMDAAAPHSGHETPAGAQAKADAAADAGVAAAGTVQQNLESHLNEEATQDTLGHIRLSDIPQPTDYGRYQAQFGWDGGIFTDVELDSDTINLDTLYTVSQLTGGFSTFVYGNLGKGQRLDTNFTKEIDIINYVEVKLSNRSGTPTELRCSIYDETTSTLLGSKTLTNLTDNALNRFVFDSPINITRGHIIQVRIDTNNTGDASNFYSIEYYQNGDLLSDSFFITTTDNWISKTDQSGMDLTFALNYTKKMTSGTATKTITPADLKKWGNLKWTQNTPANTDVVCDALGFIYDGSTITYTGFGLSGSTMLAANFIPNVSVNQVDVTVELYKNGVPPNPLEIHIYDSSGDNPGSSLGSVAIEANVIKETEHPGGKYFVTIPLSSALVPGQSYFVLLKTVGGDSSNKYLWDFTINQTGGNYYQNTGSWSADSTRSFYVSVATKLKTNITSIADLSDIDISQYPSIKTRWTLTRDSVEDESPTVSNPSWTWEGGFILIQPTKPQVADLYNSSAIASTYYTLLDITNGKGCLTRLSAVINSIANQTNDSAEFRITVDGSSFILDVTAGSLYSRGMAPRYISSGSGSSAQGFDWLGTMFFNKSLKIEVRHTSTTSPNQLYASADYSLV